MNQKKQAGVTLLIAVLILSSIALISSAIAVFTIQEIRSSRAVSLTEPGIAAAESGGEQGIWTIKRSGTLASCSAEQKTTSTLGNGAIVSSCKSYSNAVLSLKANTAFAFLLYDPNDINNDIDLRGEVNCPPNPPSSNPSGFPYSTFSITHISGTAPVALTIIRLDGTSVINQNISPGASLSNISIPQLGTCVEARMKVTLLSTADAVVDVNTDQGMPTVPTVDSSGCTSKSVIANCTSSQELFSRRINIVVPTGALSAYTTPYTTPPNTWSLIVTKAGSGTGTVSDGGGGISCGSVCQNFYLDSSSVTLTATPDIGAAFTGWSGACAGAGTCALTMTSDKAVMATFASTLGHIGLNPTSFSFSGVSGGSTPAAQTLTISNTGPATLNWTGATDQNWCHVTASGSVNAGSSGSASVSVDAPSNVGTFNCTVTISGNADNSPQTATVTYTVTPATTLVDYLIVAGGGGGGNSGGGSDGEGYGGGGGGGVVVATNQTFASGSYAVTVGSGGAVGVNGSNSIIAGIATATGGGKGGNYTVNGSNGGSGGGGGGIPTGTGATTGGTGTIGQGSNGGFAPASIHKGGGGGGAGAVGNNGNSLVGGNGGAGISNSYSGSAVIYGGGGGGGAGTGGIGGSGGGGHGEDSNDSLDGRAGTANTGGGGGGGANDAGVNQPGKAGGSGIVIIRYPDTYPAASGTTGSPTITVTGGYRIYKFTSSGSITLP